MNADHFDVVIIGAGLAGLTLARQLRLNDPSKTILHLEKRKTVPGRKQKVGESTVQVGGYYFSKTLDLEEYFHTDHFMKYNLRFMWPTAGKASDIEDYGQGYIRNYSNIASYQIDRNKFEDHLVITNSEHHSYTLITGAAIEDVTLNAEAEPHQIHFKHNGESRQVSADWVVDTSGRKRLLARQMETTKDCDELTHGSSWFWVDGIINIEKLTATPYQQILKRPSRRQLGHLPYWLSTNSLMGEGFWIWIITLQGRTSIGVVYDQECIDPARMSNAQKMLEWIDETFPVLTPAFNDKKIIDFATLRNYSYDCVQTINKDRWAISGEAGRFTDPLYSPGSDAIAIHNTLITDAICSNTQDEVKSKTSMFESMFKIVYRSFIPSFSQSYRALGDHETFFMKYTWELSVYFAFYVFPFINQLYTQRLFLIPYFRRFAAMGAVNRNLLTYVTEYYQWKKQHLEPASEPVFTDFTEAPALARAAETFYEVGLEPKQAVSVLDAQMEHMFEYARYLIAHIDAIVLDQPDLIHNAAYIEKIDINDRVFDLQTIRQDALAATDNDGQPYAWSFCPSLMSKTFHGETRSAKV